MLLMAKDQKAQFLQGSVFSKVCMADGTLFILLNDSLPVAGFVSRRSINNELRFILHLAENTVPVGLSFDKLHGMAHQLHQAVIVGKLSLGIRNIPDKRRVLFYVSCNIDRALHIPVIVSMPNVFLEQSFPHCRF